jgi:site-specific recombinase XerD
MSELALLPQTTAAVSLFGADRVRLYLESARSRNTIGGYRSSFNQFRDWCEVAELMPLPATPETIAMYLGAQAGRLKASTLEHHLSAITKAHKAAGYDSPIRENMLVSEMLKGIKRTHGSAVTRKAPILTDDLRLMLRCLPAKLVGIRDRALLLVGFVGAFRRSELVSLDLSDLKFTSEGLLITLRRSKTDQEGVGREVALPHGGHESTCPVRALQAWLAVSGIEEGPVFRSMNRHGRVFSERLSDHAVALVVKRYAEKAGLDSAALAGHSLRAGFVTSAARAGAPERQIMRTTGHHSIEMLMRYVRHASAFTDNAAVALGL